MPKQNITFALFDVRPIDPVTKRVNFEFINNLKSVINLSSDKEKLIIPHHLKEKETVLQELQTTLAESVDLNKELESFGGQLIKPSVFLRPRHTFHLTPGKDKNESSENLDKFRKEFSKMFSISPGKTIGEKEGTKLLEPPPYLPWAPDATQPAYRKEPQTLDLSMAGKEIDTALASFLRTQPKDKSEMTDTSYQVAEKKASKFLIYFVSGIAVAFVFAFLSVKLLNFKNNILQRSNQAYLNLSSVQDNISEFDFLEAASSFTLAAKNFELIHEDLKKASSVFKVLDKVFLGGVSNTSNLVEAGELISEAGLDLASALEKISGVNLISIIQPESQTNILEVLRQFRLNLIQASRNLNRAGSLISDSDSSLIPESERNKIEEFKTHLPEFSGFIEKAIDYSEALMVMLGQSSPQRYVFLFQNSSELRPTGGFPGSYALVEFDKGVMTKFLVDDIYNPDGQMKEKIIPPRPLQRATPNWGMRDANWFIDFRTSAKKVAEFYYKDTRILVDGVIAINVGLIPEILKITGPIEMPEFGLFLNS
ncbi:MAG: DUF4012 domain-containing protein, partial [Patescibacteria group bacterium]